MTSVGQGTDHLIHTGYKGIDLISLRTLELAEYCYMVNGSFEFEFH